MVLFYHYNLQTDNNINTKSKKFKMLRKNKIIIAIAISCVVALVLGLVLGGLDRLDMENYGINYNYITANFSDQIVYRGGLNLVGPSNVLLEIPRTYRVISLDNIKTYTKDFFPVQINAQASYAPIVSGNDTLDFPILRDFYINFGPNPQEILSPVIRNQIVRAASSYNSSDYQASSISTTLQSQIQSSVNSILNKWSIIDAKILLSSIVCKGISFNLQGINRKITGLNSQSQRVQARKADMTNLMGTLISSLKLRMGIITDCINQRITAVKTLISDTNLPLYQILQAVQGTSRNLSFASSQLTLRPELYLIDKTKPY